MRRIIIGLLAVIALGTLAGQTQQTLPSNTVVGRLGIGPGPAQSIPFATLAANLIGGGIATNTRNTLTASDAIRTSDCGKTLQLGTGTTGFFTLTVPATTDFNSACTVRAVNGDTVRSKALGGAGLPANAPLLLWQRQSIEFSIINGAWAMTGDPGRLKVGAGETITLNVDFTNGVDTNDGRATGAGNALKTHEACVSLIGNYFDFNGSTNPGKAICLGTAGTTDTTGIHQAFHAFVGCNGGACVKIDGGGGTISSAIQFYFSTVVQVRNVTLSNAGGNCLESLWGGKIYVLDAVTFGACTVAQTRIGDGAGHVEFDNSYSVSGNATYHILVADGGTAACASGVVVNTTTPITVTNWVAASTPSSVNLQPCAFNLGSGAVTVTNQANASFNGVILRSTQTLAVTGAVSGTAGVCRVSLASSATLAVGQLVTVAGINGATGCNVTATVSAKPSGTTFELTGTTFGGAYTNGGTALMGLPGNVAGTTSTGGQLL